MPPMPGGIQHRQPPSLLSHQHQQLLQSSSSAFFPLSQADVPAFQESVEFGEISAEGTPLAPAVNNNTDSRLQQNHQHQQQQLQRQQNPLLQQSVDVLSHTSSSLPMESPLPPPQGRIVGFGSNQISHPSAAGVGDGSFSQQSPSNSFSRYSYSNSYSFSQQSFSAPQRGAWGNIGSNGIQHLLSRSVSENQLRTFLHAFFAGIWESYDHLGLSVLTKSKRLGASTSTFPAGIGSSSQTQAPVVLGGGAVGVGNSSMMSGRKREVTVTVPGE